MTKIIAALSVSVALLLGGATAASAAPVATAKKGNSWTSYTDGNSWTGYGVVDSRLRTAGGTIDGRLWA